MIEYMIYYVIIAVLVFMVAYHQMPKYENPKRIKGSFILSVLWPITAAIMIMILLEDLKDYIKYGRF